MRLIYSPLTIKVAAHMTVPPEFEATHEYSPSWSGRTLEISNWQVSPDQDILKTSDFWISLSLQNQEICRSGDTAFIHTQDHLNHKDLLSNSSQTKSGPGDLNSIFQSNRRRRAKEGLPSPETLHWNWAGCPAVTRMFLMGVRRTGAET